MAYAEVDDGLCKERHYQLQHASKHKTHGNDKELSAELFDIA